MHELGRAFHSNTLAQRQASESSSAASDTRRQSSLSHVFRCAMVRGKEGEGGKGEGERKK